MIFKEDQEYLAFDFETCSANCLSLNNFPWQLGFIRFRGYEILEEKLYYLYWKDLPITPEAAAVTKFDKRVYDEKAEDPGPVLDYFESILYNPNIMSIFHHGLGFDAYIHKIWRANLGKKSDWSYLNRAIDTDALARGIKKGIKYKEGQNFLAYQYSLGRIIEKGLKTNLTALGKENNIDVNYDQLHDSINDCRLLKMVWEKYIKFNI